ncbi:RNA-directed DNA polymerase, eukaryota [Tanacetum coccineum]
MSRQLVMIPLTDLKVKGTDLTSYTQRFQELALMCERIFSEKSDKIKKYVGGLPNMIHGSVMASKPKTMQDTIEIATELMDKKISTLAERQAENKRKLDNNNQAQQQPPKKQRVAIAYTAGSGERKEYARTLPLCNKCKFHHNGQCTVKCANCKRVGHLTQDCRSPAATNNQRNPTCYECGNQGHYRSDCPKLKNQNHGNQAGDDAVFVGQWNAVNIDTIIHVLECVFYASGMRINRSKSKLIGIAVEDDKVELAASKIGCLTLKPLFSYLGSGYQSDPWRRWESGEENQISFPIYLDRYSARDGVDEVWRKDIAFKNLYPRLYALESCKDIVVASKLVHPCLDHSFRRALRSGVEQEQFIALINQVQSISLVPCRDRRVWSLEGSGEFSVTSLRKLIDDKMLPEVSSKTRWVKAIPIKVNVHAWKVRLDYLPMRFNISRRGMVINSISCPICDNGVESTSHLFFSCQIVKDIVRRIVRWWDISFMELSSYEEWVVWLSNLRLSSKLKSVLEGVFYVMWWHIWSFRNKKIFGSKNTPMATIFEDVVSMSFYLCWFRCKASFSWIDWLKNPHLVSL